MARCKAKHVVLLALCLLPAGLGQNYEFCTTGVDGLELVEDAGQPSVDVIFVQAPLFSTNPKFGQKLGLFGAYHSALVLSQGNGTGQKHWTLEFDFTGGSILSGVLPKFEGDRMIWNNDARYCLTEGLLWGRDHWTKTFDVVATLSGVQVYQLLDAARSVNRTAHGTRPQYQLWRVSRTNWFNRIKETLIQDTTCADGAIWMFHHIAHILNVPLKEGYTFRGTATVLNAESVERVNRTDAAAMADVTAYFRNAAELASNVSIFEKIHDLFRFFPVSYVYDTNAGEYYRLVGSGFPWLETEYVEYKLVPSPASRSSPVSLLI